MKKIYFVSFFILLFSSVFSQTFQRTYGGTASEIGTCIKATPDGNYIISGFEASFTGSATNFYLVKVDPQGNHLWSKTYGTNWRDKPYYVSVCSDGGFILTGTRDTTVSGINSDLYLVRTDSDGNLKWTNSIAGTKDEFGWYVVEANDGGFLATGSTSSFSSGGDYDGYLVKVNSAGALQWTKIYGGTSDDFLFSISPTNDGGYILGGESGSHSFGSSDNWLIKTNSNGDTLWTKQIGRLTEESCNVVFQTNDGGFILAGDVHKDTISGAHHISLIKTDSNGNMLWNKAYGGNIGAEIAYDIKPAPNNEFWVLAYTGNYGAGGQDFLLLRTDNMGNLKWAKTYGGTNAEDPWFFQTTTDGGVMMIGATKSFGAGQADEYLVKADSLGVSKCNYLSCMPELDNPVLQTKSGFNVISGGNQKTALTNVTNPSTQTNDPCAFVSVEEENEKEFSVSVFPNPSADGKFQVSGIRYQESQIEIYNLLGEKIYSSTTQLNNLTIQLKEGSGIYFYKISSEGKIATGKLVVE